MKKFRLLAALVLVLGLVFSLPYAAQAEEEWQEVTLTNAYKVSDTQIVLQFSEPIAFGEIAPFIDIRMTNKGENIIGVYDNAGNRTRYYNWHVNVAYLNSNHDCLIVTLNEERDDFGCDGISDFLGSYGSLPADVKAKLETGTYKFIVSIEELAEKGTQLKRDGKISNVYAKANKNAYLWPTRPTATEAANWDLAKLSPKPADMVVDEDLFESVGIATEQVWDFNIMSLGTGLSEEDNDTKVSTVTVVQNDPIVIAVILAGSVLIAVVLVLVFVLASKKKKGKAA